MGYKRKETKAKINWGWDAPEDRKSGKASRKTNKKINKTIKNAGVKTLLCVLLVLIVFAGIGVGSSYFLTKDDCFTLKGEKDVVISTDDGYLDPGAKVVEFGRDKSHKIEVETNLRFEDGKYLPQLDEYGNPVAGQYYIIYKAKTFRYYKFARVERIRFVTFEDAE